jgi:hypothetical protein
MPSNKISLGLVLALASILTGFHAQASVLLSGFSEASITAGKTNT